MSDDRVLVIDDGMRRHAALILAASSFVGSGSVLDIRPPRSTSEDSNLQLSPRAMKRLAEMKRERAREKAGRERRHAEMNERLLRQRIASGKDDRDDKYLHAAARRRREAERASLSPSIVEAGE